MKTTVFPSTTLSKKKKIVPKYIKLNESLLTLVIEKRKIFLDAQFAKETG
jgi:hypothetical protein